MIMIPAGQKLIITKSNNPSQTIPKGSTCRVMEDLSINLTSDFGPIIEHKGNALLSTLTSSFKGLSDMGFSGSFKQQGFQIWKSTKPIDFSLSLSFQMETEGNKDVWSPAKELMKLVLPTVAKNGWGLIPPGPNVLDALGLDVNEDSKFLNNSGAVLSVSIGSYFYLDSVIITKVQPVVKKYMDSDGFPIGIQLSVDFRTTDIANTQMIDDMTVLNSSKATVIS